MSADKPNETISPGSESNSAPTVGDGVFYRFLEKLRADRSARSGTTSRRGLPSLWAG